MFKVNSWLEVRETSNSPSIDPVTGNPIFTETSSYKIEASLEEDQEAVSTLHETEGVDGTVIYLSGRAMNPRKLPASMKPGSIYDFEFNNGYQLLKGKFYLLPSLGGRLALDSVFGDWITGYMVY